MCLFTVKHLWDERPSDWPGNIPFKDPNNAVKDGKYIFLHFVTDSSCDLQQVSVL